MPSWSPSPSVRKASEALLYSYDHRSYLSPWACITEKSLTYAEVKETYQHRDKYFGGLWSFGIASPCLVGGDRGKPGAALSQLTQEVLKPGFIRSMGFSLPRFAYLRKQDY
ncbi:hypothetical protein ElyMa_003118400 [Elysia marginata]|uniref:Uncharacterized protein n=1 Tax=Elysia marginata TaxID=1093978 RepID=A0AAV4ISS3_9GAST|nr:hypothetical protein ElyMa_003118400 [Elysia marginata]